MASPRREPPGAMPWARLQSQEMPWTSAAPVTLPGGRRESLIAAFYGNMRVKLRILGPHTASSTVLTAECRYVSYCGFLKTNSNVSEKLTVKYVQREQLSVVFLTTGDLVREPTE